MIRTKKQRWQSTTIAKMQEKIMTTIKMEKAMMMINCSYKSMKKCINPDYDKEDNDLDYKKNNYHN